MYWSRIDQNIDSNRNRQKAKLGDDRLLSSAGSVRRWAIATRRSPKLEYIAWAERRLESPFSSPAAIVSSEAIARGMPRTEPDADQLAGRRAPTVAVVIPCYRVARHLTQVVERIGPEIASIYCVIDGCPEGSEAVALEAAAKDARIRVLHHERNMGVGAAVLTGYKQAIADGADIIVKLDGDGQMAPEEIPQIVQPIVRGEADYVKGNRFFNLDDLRAMPLVRLIGNAGLTFLSKLSSGYWNVVDPTNGFTAIHASVAALLRTDRLSKRYFFESDMLFRLNTLRAVVVDVPLRARYGDEKSSLNIWRTLAAFPLYHMRNFAKRLFYNYLLRDFNAASVNLILGLLMITFGVAYGGIHWIRGTESSVVASSGTVMLAALPVVLGWQALLSFIQFDVANIPQRPVHRHINHPSVPGSA